MAAQVSTAANTCLLIPTSFVFAFYQFLIMIVCGFVLCLSLTEVYHQFHNGLGKAFPASYTRDLKAAVAKAGKIAPTGCLELPF
jgi:hypothetical protein